MPEPEPFNLFVYGTLMNPEVFRAVLGLRLVRRKPRGGQKDFVRARQAVLPGYKKTSPDHTYLYAVPESHGRIRGLLAGPLPGDRLVALRHYEGRNYSRRTVIVQTRAGREQAIAFVGNLKQLAHAFGYDFRDPYKQEILLEEKIDAALLEAERRQLGRTERMSRRAVAELHGSTIRDLKRRHFEAGGISDYAIRHSLANEPLRDFGRIVNDPEARALAPNYLAIVMRQVVFNQFEERIHRDFRYELDPLSPGPEYYDRTVSSLAALRTINHRPDAIDKAIARALSKLRFGEKHLVDFVRRSIMTADRLYDPHLAEHQIQHIQQHIGHGYTPLGAELEFSNIGHSVIQDADGLDRRDLQYDGFLYFPDFGLDALTWKLGGHVDDHHDKASSQPRRGFFEVALGNLSIEANISRPLTDDPWLLNQFIQESRSFYPIAPHSVHISLQLRTQHRPVQNRLLPMAAMKCLFAIAGDPVRLDNGKVQILRLSSEEIIAADPTPHMLFSEVSRRHSSASDESYPLIRTPGAKGLYVQQFKFLRLSSDLNYEPIVLALKGLQVRRRPGSFLTAKQYTSSPKHRRSFDQLRSWGRNPRPLSGAEIGRFLRAVREGLDTEQRGKPAHSGAYIAWAIGRLGAMLAEFNALVASPRRRGSPRRT